VSYELDVSGSVGKTGHVVFVAVKRFVLGREGGIKQAAQKPPAANLKLQWCSKSSNALTCAGICKSSEIYLTKYK